VRHHGDEGGVFDVERAVENTPDGPSPAAPFCYCSSLLVRSVIVVLKMKAPQKRSPQELRRLFQVQPRRFPAVENVDIYEFLAIMG
jgi:hypothetical protein